MRRLAALGLIATLAPAADAAGLASSRAFVARLEAAGRAVTTVTRDETDPLSGRPRSLRGTLALEPPDRARLELPASGEIVVVRGDGGEWLQPALGQMLRLGPDQAEAARRWWSVLLPGAEARFRERSLGSGRWLVVSGDGADSAWVTLGAAGLPDRLRFRDAAGGEVEVRFRGWRFERARGVRAFRLAAPRGIVVVDLP